MRIQVFFSGAMIIAFGFLSLQILDRDPALAFVQGALTLGGGIIIAGLFSIKMKWHGLIAAGVLAMLGFVRGVGNVPDFIGIFSGDRSRGGAPALEFGVTVTCLVLLLRVLRALQRERVRRMLEED